MPAPHRLPRASVAAALATAAGTAAHLLGAGTVTAPRVAGVFAELLPLFWLLAGRERRFVVIAPAVLAGQQLGHAWLAFGEPTHTPLPDDVSLYGHLMAAALIAGWLRVGEQRAWDACRRTADALVARCTPCPPGPAPGRRLPVTAPAAAGLAMRELRHVLVRRGPPRPA